MAPQVPGEDMPLSASALLCLENGKAALVTVSLGMGIPSKVWEKVEFTLIPHILGKALSNSRY